MKLCTLKVLQDKSSHLLVSALAAIRAHRTRTPRGQEKRFMVAEYLLAEAQGYVTGSFDLLKADNPRVSLAVSRWIVEAALNLLWATASEPEIDKRLRSLEAEALRLDALRSEGLADLCPGRAQECLDSAEAARAQLDL